jgi:hypothetical protein
MKNGKLIKKKSKAQEERTAKEFSGRVQLASGAIEACGMKGDVRTDKYLIENKFTDAPFYLLTIKTWEKIAREGAKDGGRIPILQVDIQDLQLVIMFEYDAPPISSLCLNILNINNSIRLHRDSLHTSLNNAVTQLAYHTTKTNKRKLLRVMRKEEFLWH